MGHTGSQPHQNRKLHAFRQIESIAYHIVSLLLGRRFENGDHGEFAVETGVLFVLRGVHRRVVGHQHDQPAMGSGHGRIDEGVCRHVQTHMLHADQGALTDEGDPQSGFHSRLFVRAPIAIYSPAPAQGRTLDVFSDFSGRCAGIGVHARNPCMQGAQRHGLVAQYQQFIFHDSIKVKASASRRAGNLARNASKAFRSASP